MTRHAPRAPRAARALALQPGDLLTRHAAATGSPLSLAALRHAAEAAPPDRRLDSLVAHARACRVLSIGLTAQGEAGRLFRQAAELVGDDRASRRHRDRIVEGLISTGQFELARELDSRVPGSTERAQLFRHDLANPFITSDSTPNAEQVEAWLELFSTRHRDDGIEPLSLRPEGRTVFDRLTASSADRVQHGPVISVVMTTYRPDHMVETAVRSVIAQTWQNWELLLVDDASPPDFDDCLQHLAALDERIRVIRHEVNGGVHRRRADGWRHASGEYLTSLDSDDWVHPRRLERQVRHLIDESPIPASMLHTSRLTELGGWVQPTGAWRHAINSSLMLHRDVARSLGTLADERHSADGEFRRRIEALYGLPIPAEPTRAPLLHFRYRADSASAEDFSMMRLHPGFRAYRSAYAAWHRERLGDAAALRYDPRENAERFPVPAVVSVTAPPSHDLDVLYVLDPRQCETAASLHGAVVRELTALARGARRVGFMAALSPHLGDPSMVSPHELQLLVNSGAVVEVMLGERVTADRVVVRHPEALVGVAGRAPTVTARRVELVQTSRAEHLLPHAVITSAVVRDGLESLVHSGYSTRRVRPGRLLGS